MITVEKINEAQLRVYSDDFGIEQELCDHFCFFMPGYRFTPQFKAKLWDGKVRLYDIHRKTLPNGLLEYVRAYAKTRDYPITEKETLRPATERITKEQLCKFIDKLDIHSRGKPIDLYDYQVDAIYRAINYEKMLALSPTSSGKSAIIYVIIRILLMMNKRVILLVPTTTLVGQMLNDFKDYASQVDWNADDFCHTLYGGQPKNWDKPVLISTWQSIHSITKSRGQAMNAFYKSWDAFIGDEAHRFTSNCIQQISNKMISAKWRIGTTGTIQDEKVSKLTLEGSFGPVYKVTTTKQLMDEGKVVNLKIKCITLEYPEQVRKLLKGADYQKEMDYICTNEERNRFIANLTKVTKGNTLVLFQYVDKHGKPLYKLIKHLCKDRPVHYISGETHVDTREDIRTGVEYQDGAIIVASVATLSTGVNIPSIENIIFASPSKSKIRNLQSIGRGLRLKEGKEKCNLFDISDDLSYKSKMNHTLKHFKQRIEIYSVEEFDFSMSTFKLSSNQ
jgi:superfamily II DNA or RNA helicase